MNNMWIRLAPLLIFFVLVLGMSFGLFTPREIRSMPSPMIGRQVPAFVIPTLGKPGKVFLISQWKDQVAVVNIFASYCEMCRMEHELLQRISKAPGVNLYGIAWKDSEANATAFLNEVGNPYRSVGVDQIGQVTLLLGVTGLPETYVIDKAGKIRWKFPGPLTEDDVNKKLLPLVQSLTNEP